MKQENKLPEEVKKPIYGNWRVIHPFNYLMFFCDEKRANWYIKRNLAVIVKEGEIKLTFIPKGKGSALDLYGSSPKENKCVVCGSVDRLTRHHILPHCYRRFFPEEYKGRNAHDIVPICKTHHMLYESMAIELKKEIALEYGEKDMINKLPEEAINRRRVGGYISCLIKHKDRMPQEKINIMEDAIKRYFQADHLEDLKTLLKKVHKPKKTVLRKMPSKFQLLVSKIPDLQQFVEKWRKHFVDKMAPQYLPIGWNIHRPAKRLETKD